MNGLWIRRINLTWDQTFDDTWSGRIRIEAAQPGDFTTLATIPAYIKDAWVKGKKNGQAAIIGVQPTPTLPIYEDTWGYRSVEKVPVEFQGLASSRDGGVAVTGDLGENKVFGYTAMVGNGSSVGAETNTKKKGMLSLRLRPADKLVLEVYGDYDDRVNSADRYLYFGFAGYQSESLRAGIQYAQQTRLETGDDIDLRILSAFVTKSMSKTLWLLARVDRNMDPNPNGNSIAYMPFDPSAANTFFIAGLDFKVAPGIDLIPNIECTVYDEPDGGGPTPETDLMVRMTFAGVFK
jgi:hypothetical protein